MWQDSPPVGMATHNIDRGTDKESQEDGLLAMIDGVVAPLAPNVKPGTRNL